MSIRLRPLAFSFSVLALVTACGHSEDEWQAQLDKYEKLAQEHQASVAEAARLQAHIAELESELQKQGLALQGAGSEADALKRSLEEFKARAALLERIKERFESLRAKLQKLTELGLEVTIRHNKMVISLPGDVMFASGSDKLSPKGEKVLGSVAEVLRSDDALAKRYYQVAGHTDNEPLKKTAAEFKDNWGLSVMRSREVLLFLTKPTADEGGGLAETLWSAAGYGQTDPVGANTTPEGKKKNRRVELVVQPDVEEMLDLKSLLGEAGAAPAG